MFPHISLKNVSWPDCLLAAAAGACIVFAFVPFHIFPLIFLWAALHLILTLRCRGFRDGFAYGFLMSFVINAGGFYWITYTIHVFGDLSWAFSAFLFLLFCGFGAMGFPIFTGIVGWLHAKVHPRQLPAIVCALWFTLGLPAWFTITEYIIPKLFPVYMGQCFYWMPEVIQIAELTGSIFLTFAVFSLGGALALAWLTLRRGWKFSPVAVVVPVLIWGFILGFGISRLNGPGPDGKTLRVALIQANIGSLDKAAAQRGVRSRIRSIIDRYIDMTEIVMKQEPKPELVVWPETAMPVILSRYGAYQNDIRSAVTRWNVPLITGAYAVDDKDQRRDYNAAFLLTPIPGQDPKAPDPAMSVYRKNILLAFGEYFPFGDKFPILYKWFPEVSNFAWGTTQEPFQLGDLRIGCTICYEAIIPNFFRKVMHYHPNIVVNLTNDSWFGPTTEPRHHGALAVYRAVETRVPLVRVTNTGISFVVDTLGRMSETTGIYKEGTLVVPVTMPARAPMTFYVRYGDWIILLCATLAFGLTALLLRRPDAPVPV